MDEAQSNDLVREVHNDEDEFTLTGQAAHWRDVFVKVLVELGDDKEFEELSLMAQGLVAAMGIHVEENYIIGDIMAHIPLDWEDTMEDVFEGINRFRKEDADCRVACHDHILALVRHDPFHDLLQDIKEEYDLTDAPDHYRISETLKVLNMRADELENEAHGIREDAATLDRILENC
jgi:hypothetical protein